LCSHRFALLCFATLSGFNPRGGGELRVTSEMLGNQIHSIDLTTRGAVVAIRGTVAAERGGSDVAAAVRALILPLLAALPGCQEAELHVDIDVEPGAPEGGNKKKRKHKQGPSVSVQLAATTDTGCVLSANLLQDGITNAGAAAAAVCGELGALLASGCCVDEHTADQLIVFMALAKGTSRIKCPGASSLSSQHLPTVLHFVEKVIDVRFFTSATPDGCQLVECTAYGRMKNQWLTDDITELPPPK
jgi:RNA 3'-terminal phosphate cyclase (ATP)